MDGELLKIIQLNVRIGNIVLRDQFEWDINNPHNSPEDFSESLCSDLGLGAEFMLPVAHSIREQINEHQKQAHQERRGGYQYSNYRNDTKGQKQEEPGNPLGSINDLSGRPLVSPYEQEMPSSPNQFNPSKTMIRSLDELYHQQKEVANKFFSPSPMEEPFSGWAPDIQILNENDLKKIEK